MPKRLQETKNRRLLWAVIKSMQASSHKVFEQIAKTRVQSSGSRFSSGGHLAPAHKEGLLLPLTTAGYIAPDGMYDGWWSLEAAGRCYSYLFMGYIDRM